MGLTALRAFLFSPGLGAGVDALVVGALQSPFLRDSAQPSLVLHDTHIFSVKLSYFVERLQFGSVSFPLI